MPDDASFDVPQDVIDLASRLLSAWDALRLVLPAISLEAVTPAGAKDLAPLEVAHLRMDGTVVSEERLAPGGTLALSRPADVAEVSVKGPETSPGEAVPAPGKPPPDTVVKGTPRPLPQFGVSRHRVGEFIRLRMPSDAAPGSRVYLRIKNLQPDALDVLKVVPQDYPFSQTAPILANSSQLESNRATLIELTQPSDPAGNAQFLLYYSGEWAALLHPPQAVFIIDRVS